MAGADYYALLGVPKNADENAIKKGYKKMALKWHPDRNNGSEEASKKFKEISEAFEVLSDSNKRAIYDQFGEAGLKGGGPTPGAGTGPSGFPGASGFSSSGFSGASGFPGFTSAGGGFPGGSTFTFNMGSGGKGGAFSPSDPFNVFQQFMNMGGMGSSRGFSSTGGFDDDDDDMDVDGFTSFSSMPGGMPGFSSRTGPRSSSSQRPSNSRSNSMDTPSAEPPTITRPLLLTLETLYSSPSTPIIKHLKVSRRLLSGKTEDKVLDIEVQPGWKSGTKVRFRGAGNEIASAASRGSKSKTKMSAAEPQLQDLVFVVEEKPHEVFKRDGNDLVCTLKIPLLEALTHEATSGPTPKTTHKIKTLDNRTLTVSPPSTIGVIKPGTESRIKGEGMPIRKDGALLTGATNASKTTNGTGAGGSGVQRGDLIVKWEVEFPERLTPSQREGLKKVLG